MLKGVDKLSILLKSKDEKTEFWMRTFNVADEVETLVNMIMELSEIPEAEKILKKYSVNFTIRAV